MIADTAIGCLHDLHQFRWPSASPNNHNTAVTLSFADREAVTHFLRGRVKELDWGTSAPSEKAPCRLMVALRYHKLGIGRSTGCAIDVPSMLPIIDGVDRLEGQRRALGL